MRGALFLFVVSIYMGLPQWGAALLLTQFVFGIAAARNSPEALQVLLVFALGPALAHLVSAALLRGFPLDETAHAAVRRELDRKADPSTL